MDSSWLKRPFQYSDQSPRECIVYISNDDIKLARVQNFK